MKTTQPSGTRPVRQTVAGSWEFKDNGKAIAIEFTDQQLSLHAGSATFWGWLRPLDRVRSLQTVPPQLSQPIQRLLRDGLEYQAMSWPSPRRLLLIRHHVRGDQGRGGKRLIDVPGYRFQALVTSLPAVTHRPQAVWRYYNGRPTAGR